MHATSHKNRRRTKSILSKSRWAAYAAAGAATALGAQEVAEAGIVYSGIINVRVDAEDSMATASYSINFDKDAGDTNVDLVMAHIPVSQGGPGFALASGKHTGMVRGFTATSFLSGQTFYYASNLMPGELVNQKTFLRYGTMAYDNWPGASEFQQAGDGYIGFSFEGDSNTYYGWLRVNMDGPGRNAFTVVEWAYGDASITVGQKVPEPGSLGLLATGAIGLLLWRRVRRDSKQA